MVGLPPASHSMTTWSPTRTTGPGAVVNATPLERRSSSGCANWHEIHAMPHILNSSLKHAFKSWNVRSSPSRSRAPAASPTLTCSSAPCRRRIQRLQLPPLGCLVAGQIFLLPRQAGHLCSCRGENIFVHTECKTAHLRLQFSKSVRESKLKVNSN
jgi:hypothetical protein